MFFLAKKAGALFVDLTAAYDTVWQAARYMVRMIMQLTGNHNFTFTIGYNASRMASHSNSS